MTVRVVVADDQALLRAGFRRLLESEPDIEVVGEAENGRDAVDLVRTRQVDVVLMDIRMPVLDGVGATAEITRTCGSRVLVLTTYDLDEYVFSALSAGASGFLLKDSPPDDLIRAIHVVSRGESLLSPRVTTRLVRDVVSLRSAERRAAPALRRLTDRERQVLEQLGRGRSNAEIATRLHVGESTVKTHVAAVLTKLGLRDRVQAVVFCYETGVVRPGQE